jgi:hypothetical protein
MGADLAPLEARHSKGYDAAMKRRRHPTRHAMLALLAALAALAGCLP